MFYPLVSLAAAAAAVVAAPTSIQSRAPSGSKTVIIQLFEWSWDSIAAECTNFIGPAGYGYVQVSPPAEHIAGSQWWTDYQPVSYTLTSKRGNRSQFQNMIKTCKSAGVGVIADTIFNHMAGIEGGTGVGGSSFTHYNYPGIYQNQDFHHCGLQSGDDIVNYNNRVEVQTCELVNLADLATDTEYVRGRLAAYANDLLSLGVVGLRLDAAKHIPAGDIANILGRLTSKPYITQEVIFGSGEPVQPSEYTGNGDVQEFRYTTTIRDAFQSGGISSLNGLENRGWVASSGANVFVANHDTERDGSSLSYKSGSTYTLAQVFMLAYPYGTPTVLSSYTFSDKDAGSPSNGAGSCSGSGGANGWQCQHRWTAIAGMVKWRNGVSGTVNNWVTGTNQQIAFGRGSSGFVAINNADSAWTRTFTTPLAANSYCDMISGAAASGGCTGASPSNGAGSCSGSGGANGWQCQHRWTAIAGMVKWRNGVSGTVNNWVTGTNQQIAFGRGSSGFVAINNADSAWTRTFTTPLAANSYCDMISGAAASGGCTGASYTVSGGTLTVTIPARSAIALFTGAIGTGSGGGGGGGGSATMSFQVNSQTTSGDNIFLVGSTSQLGSWAPASSIAMSSASYPIWTVSVTMPAGTAFSYKYIRKTSSGSVVWESDPNRSATAPSSGSSTLNDTWR
ncbi:unnamed protein product [Rhizoctonia solani]|uniref:Alpha-amylase n=1 Tax=Rhizoctonia solani TaxID=456999 RepID=A0A8H3GXX9_9AGAM|nr:unnamed protein product [Rhizoctonia solani]